MSLYVNRDEHRGLAQRQDGSREKHRDGPDRDVLGGTIPDRMEQHGLTDHHSAPGSAGCPGARGGTNQRGCGHSSCPDHQYDGEVPRDDRAKKEAQGGPVSPAHSVGTPQDYKLAKK